MQILTPASIERLKKLIFGKKCELMLFLPFFSRRKFFLFALSCFFKKRRDLAATVS